MTIELALRNAPTLSQRRQLRYVSHTYDWQRRRETAHDRQVTLHTIGEEIRERVRTHLEARDPDMLLVVAAPPGVGKSYAVAELGAHTGAHPLGTFNIAWIAPRKDMITSVTTLQRYHQRVGCTPENCPDADLHALYAAKGYNTWAVHKAHPTQCDYMRQIYQQGSTVYQIPHVSTPYPTGHADGIVIDELDPTQWLTEREMTRDQIEAAAGSFDADGIPAQFLRAVEDTIAACEPGTHGRALFDALNRHSNGLLADWIGVITQDADAMHPRPYQEPDIFAHQARQQAKKWPPIVLPRVVRAVEAELSRWQSGDEWNSLLRTGETQDGMPALYITEPRQFIEPDSGVMPPRVLLDGTADKELLARLFGDDMVSIYRPDVPPPPHMQHIAVRTGTRYGKTSLERTREDRERAAAQLLYLLRELGLDPDGEKCKAGKVGLISYKGAVPYLRRALGIPQGRTGYFWGIRGSNALEDCDILLVVGTPTLRDEELFRLSRALYHADPVPIDIRTHRRDGQRYFADERVQRLSEYLIRAELTQCAHRNRPLRHDRRTVVTLGVADVDYLPATRTVTEFPRLTIDGLRRDETYTRDIDARLTEAYERILETGEEVTVRRLREEVRVRTETITAWLRDQRGGSHTCVSQKA